MLKCFANYAYIPFTWYTCRLFMLKEHGTAIVVQYWHQSLCVRVWLKSDERIRFSEPSSWILPLVACCWKKVMSREKNFFSGLHVPNTRKPSWCDTAPEFEILLVTRKQGARGKFSTGGWREKNSANFTAPPKAFFQRMSWITNQHTLLPLKGTNN